MISTTLDIEAIELEDLEYARPCTPYAYDCGVEAMWLVIYCCGCEMPVCDKHKTFVAVDVAELNWMYDSLTCFVCGFVARQITFVIEPI